MLRTLIVVGKLNSIDFLPQKETHDKLFRNHLKAFRISTCTKRFATSGQSCNYNPWYKKSANLIKRRVVLTGQFC